MKVRVGLARPVRHGQQPARQPLFDIVLGVAGRRLQQLTGKCIGMGSQDTAHASAGIDRGQERLACNAHRTPGRLNHLPGERDVIGKQAAKAEHAFIADRCCLDVTPIVADHDQRDDAG